MTNIVTSVIQSSGRSFKVTVSGRGPQGPQGVQGVQGKSTYDLWIESGKTGTMEEFLQTTDTVTSINGKTGAISKADIVALGIPDQDTVYAAGTNISISPQNVISSTASGGADIEAIENESKFLMGDIYKFRRYDIETMDKVYTGTNSFVDEDAGGTVTFIDIVPANPHYITGKTIEVKFKNNGITVSENIVTFEQQGSQVWGMVWMSGNFAFVTKNNLNDDKLTFMSNSEFDEVTTNEEVVSDNYSLVYAENRNDYPDGESFEGYYYELQENGREDLSLITQALLSERKGDYPSFTQYKIIDETVLSEGTIDWSTAEERSDGYVIETGDSSIFNQFQASGRWVKLEYGETTETIFVPQNSQRIAFKSGTLKLENNGLGELKFTFKWHLVWILDYKLSLINAEFDTLTENPKEDNNYFYTRNYFDFLRADSPLYQIGDELSEYNRILNLNNGNLFMIQSNIPNGELVIIRPYNYSELNNHFNFRIVMGFNRSYSFTFLDLEYPGITFNWINHDGKNFKTKKEPLIIDFTLYGHEWYVYVIGEEVEQEVAMPISGGILENYTEKLTTVSESGGSIDLSLGNVFQHTPSVNTVYSITNAVNGQAHSFTLIINMGATVRTLTFPASVKWQGGEIPGLTTAGKTYVLTFMTVDGGTTWLGMFGGEF